MPVYFFNGQVARAEDVAALALVNYGHFTTFQVRDLAVQGLDLHLRRLQESSLALFGCPLDEARARQQMLKALKQGKTRDATLRLTVFSRQFSAAQLGKAGQLDLFISLTDPGRTASALVRIKSVYFVRDTPDIKHVGLYSLLRQKRLAVEAGYHDVLFVDNRGALVEGSFWNLGLWDGRQIIWPQGPSLPGTQQQLLQSGLTQLGVAQSSRRIRLLDVPPGWAAFTCNSRGQQGIASIDNKSLADPGPLLQQLDQALATQPWQAI